MSTAVLPSTTDIPLFGDSEFGTSDSGDQAINQRALEQLLQSLIAQFSSELNALKNPASGSGEPTGDDTSPSAPSSYPFMPSAPGLGSAGTAGGSNAPDASNNPSTSNGADGSSGTDSSNGADSSSGTSNSDGTGNSSSSSNSDSSTDSAQTVLNGDATHLPSQDETCPDNVSMDDIMNADGGLLKKMGNQQLKGDGAKGITGGIEDNFAKKEGGTSAADIDKDKNLAWRVLHAAEAFKDAPETNGTQVPASERHNGNIPGLDKSGKAMRGSVMGEIQDWDKGAISGPEPLPENNNGQLNADGSEKSGIQQFGTKVVGFFKGVGKAIGNFFKGIGNGVKHFFQGVGNGIKAFFTGHPGNAVRDFVGGVQTAFSDVTKPIITAPSTIVNSIPGLSDTGFGKFVNNATDKVNSFVDNTVNRLTNVLTAPAANFGDFEDHLIHGDTKDAISSLGDYGKSVGEAGVVAGAGALTGGAAGAVLPGAAGFLGTAGTTVARLGGDSVAEDGLGISADNQGIDN